MTLIDSTADAGRYISKILEGRGYEIVRVVPINKGRHIILVTEKEKERKAWYVLYKRAPFFTFSRQFDLETGCFGETVNVSYFQDIQRASTPVEMLFCYPDGVIYSTSPKEWGEFVRDNDTIRITQSQGETTTSVPLRILNRWDKPLEPDALLKWVNEERRNIFKGVYEKIVSYLRKLTNKKYEIQTINVNH